MLSSHRLDHDFEQFSKHFEKFRSHFQNCKFATLPQEALCFSKTHLEIGAGTGGFFSTLATLFPDEMFIAIERDRMRGKALARRAEKQGLPNFRGLRGNALPAIFYAIKDQSLDSIFILYPCPWPKLSQRKNRWYFHSLLPNAIRILKPGGFMVWASDQSFYIEEAEYICRKKYGLRTMCQGLLQENPYNHLAFFPSGRTKFERTFRAAGAPLYELVTVKTKNC